MGGGGVHSEIMGFKEKRGKITGFKEKVGKPEEKVGTERRGGPPKAAIKRKKNKVNRLQRRFIIIWECRFSQFWLSLQYHLSVFSKFSCLNLKSHYFNRTPDKLK